MADNADTKEKAMRQKILAIMSNPDLNPQEKARQMQEVHTGKWSAAQSITGGLQE